MNNHPSLITNPKYMVITGAAGGIGRATVKLFAKKAWRVIGIDRADFGAGFPENGQFIQADISEPSQLEAIFEQAKEFTNTIDALINNAAYQITTNILSHFKFKVRTRIFKLESYYSSLRNSQ